MEVKQKKSGIMGSTQKMSEKRKNDWSRELKKKLLSLPLSFSLPFSIHPFVDPACKANSKRLPYAL